MRPVGGMTRQYRHSGGALPLDVVRRAESVDRDELRVEPAEQFVHDLAAAGAGDARDDHRHRALRVLAQLELRVEQPVLQLRQLVLVLDLGQVSPIQHFMQHCASPLGTCCVMQWMLPPPSRISRPGTPTTSRPGNSRFSFLSAAPSRFASSSGTTTRRLPM